MLQMSLNGMNVISIRLVNALQSICNVTITYIKLYTTSYVFKKQRTYSLNAAMHDIVIWNIRIRKALENRSNMEDDRVSILEAQLAQAKQIAEESDKKYEEVIESPFTIFTNDGQNTITETTGKSHNSEIQ